MADERGYELASAISTEDADVYFNVDKSGFVRSKQYKQSVLKGHFKVGDQQYTEENYVTDGETLTVSIDQLDIALKAVSDAVAAVSPIKAVKITLSTSDVAALGTAYELFAAGGADTSYQIIDVKWGLYPSTVLDVESQDLKIYFEDDTKYIAIIRNSSIEDAGRLVRGVQIAAEHELKMNKAVYLKLSGDADPVSGSAKMEFWIVYQTLAVTPIS